MIEMFLNFYPGENEVAEEFANFVKEEMKDDPISMATLQNHFIKHRKSNSSEAKIFVKNEYC